MKTSCKMMNQPLTISDLDSLRAEVMMALLDAEGRKSIWQFDIISREQAFAEAKADFNFDNMDHALKAKDKPYCLVGPGIDDCYFSTVMELVSILYWVCSGSGYLVKREETYTNQQEVLREQLGKSCPYPFLPLKGANPVTVETQGPA